MKKLHLYVFSSLAHDWCSIYIAGSSASVQDPRAGGRAIFLAEGHFGKGLPPICQQRTPRQGLAVLQHVGRHVVEIACWTSIQGARRCELWRDGPGLGGKLLQLERCIITHYNNNFWMVLKLLFCMVEALRFPLVIVCCAWHSGSSSRVTCQKLIFCRYQCWNRWTGTTGPSGHFWMVSRQGHEGIEVSFVTSQRP